MTLTDPTTRITTRVPPAPRSPARAAVASKIIRYALRTTPVQAHLPDGTVLGAGTPDDPQMIVVRPDDLFNRLGMDVKVGFGESYMAGDWEAAPGTDLGDLLTPWAARVATIVPPPLQRLRRFVDLRTPVDDENTLSGAKRNIARHYDLSNEMFATFLDETMSYSSAWFPADPDAPGAHDLTAAQVRKVDAILDLAGVRAGMSVAEIGTGWGFLAVRAAQRGAYVTTTTLSAEQLAVARRRVEDAGVSDRVELLLRDFRDMTGRYDAVVSVEMVEAVGRKLWPSYFATLDRLLAPGGRIGLQAITMAHDRMLATDGSYGWIQKYIFPGGLIPSIHAIEATLAEHTTLEISERRDLRPHYAATLRQWRERFVARWDEVAMLGFDDAFRRVWELYLAYSEAGFRSGYIGVSQLAITRPPAFRAGPRR